MKEWYNYGIDLACYLAPSAFYCRIHKQRAKEGGNGEGHSPIAHTLSSHKFIPDFGLFVVLPNEWLMQILCIVISLSLGANASANANYTMPHVHTYIFVTVLFINAGVNDAVNAKYMTLLLRCSCLPSAHLPHSHTHVCSFIRSPHWHECFQWIVWTSERASECVSNYRYNY